MTRHSAPQHSRDELVAVQKLLTLAAFVLMNAWVMGWRACVGTLPL